MRPPADWQRVERKVGVESERALLRPADSAVMSASAKAPLKALFLDHAYLRSNESRF